MHYGRHSSILRLLSILHISSDQEYRIDFECLSDPIQFTSQPRKHVLAKPLRTSMIQASEENKSVVRWGIQKMRYHMIPCATPCYHKVILWILECLAMSGREPWNMCHPSSSVEIPFLSILASNSLAFCSGTWPDLYLSQPDPTASAISALTCPPCRYGSTWCSTQVGAVAVAALEKPKQPRVMTSMTAALQCTNGRSPSADPSKLDPSVSWDMLRLLLRIS